MREGVIQPPVEKRLRFAECPIPRFAGEDAETRRGAQCGPRGSAESGFLARRGWGAVGAAASSFCRALDGRTPRPVPETGAHTRLADRARLPRCLSRPLHPVFSHRNRLCVTTTQKTEGSSAERGGRGAGSPPGPGPHLCSRPCPPSSFPSRDSSLRRSQMPPRPGMTGIPRRSWQTGALLAQVPGPRPALQGRESHRASWSRGRPPAHNQEAASPVSSNWFPGSLRTLKLFPVPRLPRCEALTAGLPVEFSGWTALRAPYLGAGSWPRSPPGERWWSSSDLGPLWAAARLGRPAAWGAPRSASVSPRPRGQCGSFESRESML